MTKISIVPAKNKINLARVHMNKEEVRGSTAKAIVKTKVINAGMECFSGSRIGEKRREVRDVIE